MMRPTPLLIFTFSEKAAAASREAAMRRRVYPRFVSDGKMTQLEADRGIAIMEAIAAEYEANSEQGKFAL